MSSRSAEERAAARASWPGVKLPAATTTSDDLSATTTAAERIAMVWRLTLDAWALSGRPIPDYRREDAPGRVIRPVSRRE